MTENDLEAPQAEAAIPIYKVRDVDVVLDADLARLHEIETKRLNEQVKRNAERFDGGFAFQATKDEFEVLRSQIATANRVRGSGGRRSPPWVFTEHGVVMAASVVNSPRAIEAMRLVVRVFIAAKNQALAGAGSALVVAPEGGTLVATERAGTSLAGLSGA